MEPGIRLGPDGREHSPGLSHKLKAGRLRGDTHPDTAKGETSRINRKPSGTRTRDNRLRIWVAKHDPGNSRPGHICAKLPEFNKLATKMKLEA